MGHPTVLNFRGNSSSAVCLSSLRRFFVVPVADVYYIELSETQWPDKSGCPVWLKREGLYSWGRDRRCISMLTYWAAEWLLVNIKIRVFTPTRFYFRLTYED